MFFVCKLLIVGRDEVGVQGLWMSKEREVLYVIATRIRFMCPMNFNKFPMDTQTCKFQVNKKLSCENFMQNSRKSDTLI